MYTGPMLKMVDEDTDLASTRSDLCLRLPGALYRTDERHSHRRKHILLELDFNL